MSVGIFRDAATLSQRAGSVRSGSPRRTVDQGVSQTFNTETHMFSHIMIGARDRETMVAFYDAVLAPLDLRRVVELDDVDEAGVIWRKGDRRWPQFALRRPIDGLPATWGNGVQISFAAPSREAVDHAWATAIQKGAYDEGAPGLRPKYAEDFYVGYCRDPEGNKPCFVHAQGVPS